MSKRELPQVVVDLQAVRDRLTPRTMWRRGCYGPAEGPNCLMGAIMHTTGAFMNSRTIATIATWKDNVSPNEKRARVVEDSLRTSIGEIGDTRGKGVVYFNDESGNTHKGVLNLIDKTLEREKEKAGIVEYV